MNQERNAGCAKCLYFTYYDHYFDGRRVKHVNPDGVEYLGHGGQMCCKYLDGYLDHVTGITTYYDSSTVRHNNECTCKQFKEKPYVELEPKKVPVGMWLSFKIWLYYVLRKRIKT